jgi:hypothetical protein
MARSSSVRLKMPRRCAHGQRGGHLVHRPQEGIGHTREAERRHIARVLAPGQHAELVAQVREQQRAKGGVARNQFQHRGAGQFVGDDFLGGHKAAAGPPGHQAAAVKAIVGAVGDDRVAMVLLRHMALGDHEQVRGHCARLQQHLARRVVADIGMVAHHALLVGLQAVERRMGEGKGVGHADLVGSEAIAPAPPCGVLAPPRER